MSVPATKIPLRDARVAGVAVHKFGGSSLADAACFRRVATVLGQRTDTIQVVVVSAMRGVTDELTELVRRAADGTLMWRDRLLSLLARHRDAAEALLGADAAAYVEWLDNEHGRIHDVLGAIALLRAAGREALEFVQGLGEVWSSRLLADYLRVTSGDCGWMDAREVLCVQGGELGAAVDWPSSATRLAAWRVAHPQPRMVVTGFVARDGEGRATVLGRNGSDYSAAIFAVLFGADELTLWGDTDGVLSADPRLVPEAVTLSALSYDEACELAYFGAKVIHPQTMTPAIARGLPIRIRNTFNPAHAGSVIGAASAGGVPVRGLSIAAGMALVNLEGAGMIGVPGTAERAFGALRAAGVSVTMISQGSSEHSICCVVREAHADAAEAALRRAFAAELARGEIGSVAVDRGIAVLAAVGDGMSGRPGVAARLFGALARSGVNVRAIAQGASERNISVAMAATNAPRALRAVHAAFWLSPQTIGLGVIGVGKVGTALLEQLRAAMPRLRDESGLDLRLRGVADSRRMHLDDDGRDPGDWREALHEGEPLDLERFADAVQATHLPHAAIIDCTASGEVAMHYPAWLRRGIHVVTPNKQAGSGVLDRWRAIRAASAQSGARFRYEATVGAGLPVMQTLRDLIDTGDDLVAVDGIFSGTLAWLFNRYDGTQPFSALLREAHALGYTEPDPRDDLSGMDVARKLVILAREAGRELSLDEVAVESLVPAALANSPREDFMAGLECADAAMAERHARAAANGCVLRYVARLDDAGARVALVELPSAHPFAHLRLTDNIVQFTTRRYADNPLIVQGPGAGPEVTAAGVFADLLRVAAHLGARL
jgi:aspartokinase/homoserine dehydrogenase 1